jgi:hypothetical protein
MAGVKKEKVDEDDVDGREEDDSQADGAAAIGETEQKKQKDDEEIQRRTIGRELQEHRKQSYSEKDARDWSNECFQR